MTVQFLDPPGVLSTTQEAVDFTLTETPVVVSVEFQDSKTWEVVYQEGRFSKLYEWSTKVGNTFAVRRTNGWPEAFRVVVDEQPVVTPTATLQATAYSPIAQWSLGSTTNIDFTDRSGNGRHLSNTSFGDSVKGPDLRPGYFCLTRGSIAVAAASMAPFRLTGAMTVICRAYIVQRGNGPLFSCIATGETEAANYLYQLTIDNSVNPLQSFLTYWAESGAGVDITWRSNANIAASQGKWCFIAFRRAATGVVTINLNSSVYTSPALALPTGGSSTVLEIGSNTWTGGIADFSIWGDRLTDEQVAAQKESMNLP